MDEFMDIPECYLFIMVHGNIIVDSDLRVIEVPAPEGKNIIKKNISSPGFITHQKNNVFTEQTDISLIPEIRDTYNREMKKNFLINPDTCYTREEWINTANSPSDTPVSELLEFNTENDRSCIIQEHMPTYALKQYSSDITDNLVYPMFDEVSLMVKKYNKDGEVDIEEYEVSTSDGMKQLIEKWYNPDVINNPIDFLKNRQGDFYNGYVSIALDYTFDTYTLFRFFSVLLFRTIHILDHSCNTYAKWTGVPRAKPTSPLKTTKLSTGEVPIFSRHIGYGGMIKKKPKRKNTKKKYNTPKRYKYIIKKTYKRRSIK